MKPEDGVPKPEIVPKISWWWWWTTDQLVLWRLHPKQRIKGKAIVNDILKYHALDPNSAEGWFNGLSHAVMLSCDYYCKATIKNSVGWQASEKEHLQHQINKLKK
jgi:hypothetical protein